MNNISLVGRLTHLSKDNYKTTVNGHNYVWNTIAVDNKMRNHTNFIPVKMWGNQAEYAKTYLTKGILVAITGELNVVENKDTKARHFEIDVKQIASLENPQKDVKTTEQVVQEQEQEPVEQNIDSIPWEIEL